MALVNQMIPRYEKAFEIIKNDGIIPTNYPFVLVLSSDKKTKYVVNYLRDDGCPCDDLFFRKVACKHLLASKIHAGLIKVDKK